MILVYPVEARTAHRLQRAIIHHVTNRPAPTTAPGAARRQRILYALLGALTIATAVVLLLAAKEDAPGLFALGCGFLTLAVMALMADTQRGTPALVRSGRLTNLERRLLVYGVLGTVIAVIVMIIEIEADLGGESGYFAVALATGTGIFGLAALMRG